MFRPVIRPNPALWGLFCPFLPPTAPKPRRSRPAAPLFSRQNPVGSRRFCVAAARFSRFPPGTAPLLPPETRPLCVVSRRSRPLFPPATRLFPAVRPRVACDHPRFAPEVASRVPAARPGCAPPPGTQLPLGLPSRPASPLRRGEACTPPGGPQSLGAIFRRPPPSLA